MILMYSIRCTLSQPCSAVTIKPAGPDTNRPKYTVTNTLPCTLKHIHTHIRTHTHAVTYKQTHTHTLYTHADYTYTRTLTFLQFVDDKTVDLQTSQHFDYLDNGDTNKPHSKVTLDCDQIPPKPTHSIPVSPRPHTTKHRDFLLFTRCPSLVLSLTVSVSGKKQKQNKKAQDSVLGTSSFKY